MITEDYCSYEVAKLLKEKGFDKFNTYKDPTNSPCGTHYDRGNADGFIRARTEFETLFNFLNEY